MNRFALILLWCLYTHHAFAFDNEPDGFRGIAWGTELTSVAGLVSDNLAQNMLENNSLEIGVKLTDFALKSYRRTGDKLEFGNAQMESVSYQFYQDRFVGATIFYTDITLMTDSRMRSITEPDPPGYNARRRVESALSKYFGTPTESPHLLLRLAGGKNMVKYTGTQAEIRSDCRRTWGLGSNGTQNSVKPQADGVSESWRWLPDGH